MLAACAQPPCARLFDRLRTNDLLEGASLDQLPRSARAACATDKRSSRAEALAEESTGAIRTLASKAAIADVSAAAAKLRSAFSLQTCSAAAHWAAPLHADPTAGRTVGVRMHFRI